MSERTPNIFKDHLRLLTTQAFIPQFSSIGCYTMPHLTFCKNIWIGLFQRSLNQLEVQEVRVVKHCRHEPISIEDLKDASINTFKLKSHSSAHLAEQIAYMASHPSCFSKRGIDLFYSGLSELKIDNTGIDRDHKVIIAYAYLFNKLFFFDGLNQVSFTIHPEDAKRDPRWQAYCQTPGDRPGELARIHIYRHHDDNRERRLTNYIAILLHECIHAFLEIYSCRTENLDGEKCHERPEHGGKDGHGEAFQVITSSLHEATRNLLRLDLARYASMEYLLGMLVPKDEFDPDLMHLPTIA
jgi:hypothetical protein